MRRRFGLGLILGAILLGLAAGCHHASTSPPWSTSGEGGSSVLGREVVIGARETESDAEIAEARRQHKPNRLSGAWSKEAAEIEQSLGVSR